MPLAYSFRNTNRGGGRSQDAVAVCATAGCNQEVGVTWNKQNNPRSIAEKIRREGWEIDPNHQGKNACPSCIANRRTRRAGESIKTPQGEKDMKTAVNGEATALAVRELTHDERFNVRCGLDEHFDDKAGAYLNGYSDQRLGADLSLPWAAVAKLREAAYGPLKSNTELAAIGSDLRNLERAVAGAAEQAKQAVAIAEDARKAYTAAAKSALEANTAATAVRDLLDETKRRLDAALARLGIAGAR
jgi:hypothetical protein